VEVLGGAGHEHYRVQWTDEHESIYFPADGAILLPHKEEHAAAESS
jgi:hypothetical protein